MKPMTVSTPGRIYRRGQILRQCYEYDEQKYYLNRLLIPELDRRKLLQTHVRSMSERANRSRQSNNSTSRSRGKEMSSGQSLEPLKMLVTRCLQDESQQLRKRREYEMDKFKELRMAKDRQYRLSGGVLRKHRESRQLKSKYQFLLEPKSCRIFN